MDADLQSAVIDLACKGFRVFPVKVTPKPNGGPKETEKKPLCEWKDAATPYWFDLDWTGANAVGIALDPGMVVVDVDVNKGDGAAELREQWPELAATPTATVRTNSGGYHLFYRVPEGSTLRQSKLAPNIDTRVGGSGFVVAAGSPGYRVVRGDLANLAPLPERVLARLSYAGKTRARAADEDTLRGLALALDYLKKNPPTDAPEDTRRFAIAARLRGYGLAEETALKLMLAWNAASEHARDPSQIEKAVTNAYKHAHDETAGGDLPPDFRELFGVDGAEELPPEHPDRIMAALVAQSEAPKRPEPVADLWADMPAVDALVPGLLARGNLYVDVAPPESAKTYRSVDFAMCAAFGRKWGGAVDVNLPEEDRRVAFLAFEDWRGVRERMLAWATYEGISRSDLAQRVRLFGDSLQPFTDRAATAQLLAALAAYKPAVVVISTFADAMDGADAIKDQDVRAYFVRTVRTLQRLLPGVVVYAEAHMGKGNNDVLAGQSLRAAADLMTFSELDKKTKATTVTISKAPKHFARPADPIILAAEPTTVTYFADGTLKTNLVYRKPALRVTEDVQDAEFTRRVWTAIVRGHHAPGIEAALSQQAAVYGRAAAFMPEGGPTTAANIYRWAVAREDTPEGRRYWARFTRRSEAGAAQKLQYWSSSETELPANLAFVLDGRDHDPLLDADPTGEVPRRDTS